MFQEVFKFSTRSGLFPKDVQEVQEFLEVTRDKGRKLWGTAVGNAIRSGRDGLVVLQGQGI